MASSRHRVLYPVVGLFSVFLITAFAVGIHPDAEKDAMPEVDSSLSNSVVWVLTEDAVKSCRAPAAALRHMQQRLHDDVRVTVLYSGLARDDVQYIVARERINADLVSVDAREHKRLLGRPLTAAVHVIDGVEIRRSWDYLRQARWWNVNLSTSASSPLE